MQYWFLAYEIRDRKGGLITIPVANIALAGIHPLIWLSTQKERAPTATALGMINHAIFYAEIDRDMFERLEQLNYMPTERAVSE